MIEFLIFYYGFSFIVCSSACCWRDSAMGKLMQIIGIAVLCPVIFPMLLGDKL